MRHRDLMTALALAAILGVAVSAGCSTGSTSPSVAASKTAGRSATGKTIPDGTYSTVVSKAEEVKKGYKAAFVDQLLGPDGRMLTTLKLEKGFFSHFVTDDAGLVEVGDTGTVTYDPSGQLIMTSASSGCPGCVYFYRWTYQGTALTLAITRKAHDPDPADVGAEVVMNHTYRKIK